MSLLTLTQDACALVGIDVPTAVVSSTDPTYTQFVYLAQYEGDEMNRAHKWRKQKVQASFTGDGSTTIWALPTDFERFTTEQRRASSILLGLQAPEVWVAHTAASSSLACGFCIDPIATQLFGKCLTPTLQVGLARIEATAAF